jgi:hypothetical protein
LQVDAGIRSADILMCSEPPFFCKMFLGQRLSYKATDASGVMHEMKAFTRPPESSVGIRGGLRKRIFGYIGNPFGAYLLPGEPQDGTLANM